MGLFNRKPKADEVGAPLVTADMGSSFIVRAGSTTWAYKRVLKSLGWQRPHRGGQTPGLDVVVRLIAGGTGAVVKRDGYPLGFVDEQDLPRVRRATAGVGSKVITARAYIWHSDVEGDLGVRIFLP